MADVKALILKRLAEERENVIAGFRALAPEDWTLTIYTDGAAWTPHQILAHQVSTERAIHELVKDVLAGGAGMPEGFDTTAFNEHWAARLAGEPAEALYAAFGEARAQMIATVEGMQADDFARSGRHPWFGPATLGDALKLVYRHNMLHLRDVQRAVKARARAGETAHAS
jgi:hypothetical protein